MQSIQLTSSLLAAGAVLLLLLLLAPLVSTSSCNWDWLLYKDSCYAYYNQSAFWYDGEMTCKEQGGHLVSIADDHENRLVSKLSLCKSVWIGLYARDLDRITDPAGYSWTDEKLPADGGGFSRHNFSGESSIHSPLIRSEQLSWYNALYHEQHPFVCKSPIGSSNADKVDCPSRMKFFQGHCYLFSSFEVNFIEANFYCQNHSTNLVSVLSEQELHFLNTLDLSTDACEIRSVWLGLVKLSPCNPDEEGRELCYKWTDFSGKHRDFPRWAEGQPTPPGESESAQHSCVTLSGDNLIGSACNERHAFICKAAAGSISGDAFKALDASPVAKKAAEVGAGDGNATSSAELAVNSTSGEVTREPANNSSEASQPIEISESARDELPKPIAQEVSPEPEATEKSKEATEELPAETTKPAESTDKSSKSTDESSEATNESSKPIDELSKPTDESSKATDESSKAMDESSKATDESFKATDESSKATNESFKATDESSKATDESSKATDESSKPTDESSKPTDESSKPTDESSKPTDESSKPTDESSKPTDESSKPTDESSKAMDESSKATDESSKPTDESSKPTDESSKAMDESSKPTDEPTKKYTGESPNESAPTEPTSNRVEAGPISEPSASNMKSTEPAAADRAGNAIHTEIKPRKDAEERLPWGLDELMNVDWQKAAESSQY